MRAVVVADGVPGADDRQRLGDAELIVAADGGAHWLDQCGVRPDWIVGDLDSADPALVERLTARGTRIDRHPSSKDESDTELAVGRALDSGADRIDVLGALGGERLDHELANLLLLADARLAGIDVRLVRGGTTVRALRAGERIVLEAKPGDLATLIPVAGDAAGVRTAGLRYPLRGEPLIVGASRGLSNVVEDADAWVALERGTLLVVETTKVGTTKVETPKVETPKGSAGRGDQR